MNLITVRHKLEKAWSKETAYNPEFYLGDKATGQCVVTALIIQELFDGEIVTGIVTYKNVKERHYWNRIAGLDIDLTWRQYPAGAHCKFLKIVPRAQLMRNKSTKERYFKLFSKANGF